MPSLTRISTWVPAASMALMRDTPRKVAIHNPKPPRGEQVVVVLQRLVQQRLLGLALVPGAAGAGRPGGHAEGGAGGGGGDPQLPQLRERRGIVGGARRPERLPGGSAVRHPDQRPVDRAGLQVSHRNRAVVPAAVLAVRPSLPSPRRHGEARSAARTATIPARPSRPSAASSTPEDVISGGMTG